MLASWRANAKILKRMTEGTAPGPSWLRDVKFPSCFHFNYDIFNGVHSVWDLCDRTGNWKMPYRQEMVPSIPGRIDPSINDRFDYANASLTFEDLFANRVAELVKIADGRYIDIIMSGGLDSLIIYTAFMRNVENTDQIRPRYIYSTHTNTRRALNVFNPPLHDFIKTYSPNAKPFDQTNYHKDFFPLKDLYDPEAISVTGHASIKAPNVKEAGNVHKIQATALRVYKDIDKYIDEPWEKAVTDEAKLIDDDKIHIPSLLEEMHQLTATAPCDVSNNIFKAIRWVRIAVDIYHLIHNPRYLMKSKSIEDVDKVFVFFHDEEIFKWHMKIVFLDNPGHRHFMEVNRGEPGNNHFQLMDYVVDYVKNPDIHKYSIMLPHESGNIHTGNPQGLVRYNDGTLYDPAEPDPDGSKEQKFQQLFF